MCSLSGMSRNFFCIASTFFLRLCFSTRSISSWMSIASNSFRCQYILYSKRRALSVYSNSAFELKLTLRGDLSMSLNGSPVGPYLATASSGVVFYLSRVLSWFCTNLLAVNVRPLSFYFYSDGIIGTDLRVFRFFFTTVFDSELLAPFFKYWFSLTCSLASASFGCNGYGTSFSFFSSCYIALRGSYFTRLRLQMKGYIYYLFDVIRATSFFFSSRLRSFSFASSLPPPPRIPPKSSLLGSSSSTPDLLRLWS